MSRIKQLKGPLVAVAGVGAVLSGLMGYYTTYQTVNKTVAPAGSGQATAGTLGTLSIIALPFTNLTGDPAKAHLADGLTASITADMSRIQDAVVVPAASAAAYKDKPVSLPALAKELGVRFVLQGNVQSNGTKLRINAQLADATKNTQLWSESFDGDLSDLFALQDSVTARLSTSIGSQMVLLAARESETRKSSPKVADLLLRARAVIQGELTIDHCRAAQALYRQALKLEPDNVQAMMGLGRTLSLLNTVYRNQLDATALNANLRELSALVSVVKEREPGNPATQALIAGLAFATGDAEGYRLASETRAALDPRNASAWNSVGNIYIIGGEPERAVTTLKKALGLAIGAQRFVVNYNLGFAYLMLNDDTQAMAYLRNALALNPGQAHDVLPLMAILHSRANEAGKAAAVVEQAKALPVHSRLADYKEKIAAPAFVQWFDTQLTPAWRKAGLPE